MKGFLQSIHHVYLKLCAVVLGRGFIGRSFKVENTAGPLGYQAVAFRGTADRTVMYQVTFDGYQDTLYAHSFRRHYRGCTILRHSRLRVRERRCLLPVVPVHREDDHSTPETEHVHRTRQDGRTSEHGLFVSELHIRRNGPPEAQHRTAQILPRAALETILRVRDHEIGSEGPHRPTRLAPMEQDQLRSFHLFLRRVRELRTWLQHGEPGSLVAPDLVRRHSNPVPCQQLRATQAVGRRPQHPLDNHVVNPLKNWDQSR